MKKIILIFSSILLILIIGIVVFMGYMRLFGSLQVVEKEMGPYTMVYESFVGDYKETGKVFDCVYKNLKQDGITTTDGIGIYYDDPRKVSKDKLRSDCGCVLEEKDLEKMEKLKGKYQIKILKKKPSMVVEFPVRNPLSYVLGPMKGYPALMKYAETKGYTIDMTYELYDMEEKKIYFVTSFEE